MSLGTLVMSCATYTNYLQSHSSHIDILRDNCIYIIIRIHITYSPTYSSVETDDMHRY